MVVVDNLEDLCVTKLFSVGYELLNNSYVEEFYLFMRNFSFPESSSQKLLKKILLHDCSILQYFAPFLYRITEIRLESKKFDNYSFLHQFDLSSFSCKSLKHLDIDDFLMKFNEKTRSTMRYLRLRKIEIRTETLFLLPQFTNIKFLDISCTSLVTSSLEQISSSMQFLVGLNIAVTKVDDLHCLPRQLEFLDIHDLAAPAYNNIFTLLGGMEKLQHLEMNVSHDDRCYLGVANSGFVNLKLFDISGHQRNIGSKTVLQMIKQMPKLKYFIYYGKYIDDGYKIKEFIQQHSNITVIGQFSTHTLTNGLVYSLDHPRYLNDLLHHLFEMTGSVTIVVETFRSNLIKHMHQLTANKHNLLVAITAVVYNLTKGHLAEQWSSAELSDMMGRFIYFLNSANGFQQLTVNIFLIVCNSYIIQHAVFDKLRFTQLIFAGMVKYDANNISQAGVIVISIIASELTKTDLNTLVSDVANFRILFTLICHRCVLQADLDQIAIDCYLTDLKLDLRLTGEPVFDFTLKFALSALWNLTDECTRACQQFIEQQGLFIYFVMIEKFKTAAAEVYSHIYYRCLGLLNNVAEEITCRSALLTTHYMDFLVQMLGQEDIQMAYFAGGILSNLLLISDEEWNEKCNQQKEFYENRIYDAVNSWIAPSYLMASYRSFSPFQNLTANAGSSRAILLWVVWALRHTLKIERMRYSTVLSKHGQLIEYIEMLSLNRNPLYSRIRTIASHILILFDQDITDPDLIS